MSEYEEGAAGTEKKRKDDPLTEYREKEAMTPAKEKEHEEENLSTSDVPAAVQKAAESEAKGGKIVRWEKEGANYEAVIDKNGKEWVISSMPTANAEQTRRE